MAETKNYLWVKVIILITLIYQKFVSKKIMLTILIFSCHDLFKVQLLKNYKREIKNYRASLKLIKFPLKLHTSLPRPPLKPKINTILI